MPNAAPFFAPDKTATPGQFHLDVADHHCVTLTDRPQFIMGGVSFACVIAAMEQMCAQPLIYAAAQFLAPAASGTRLTIDVETPVVGKRITQAQAVLRDGTRRLIQVHAALGKYDGYPDTQYAQMPALPPPAECARIVEEDCPPHDLRAQFENRVAETSKGAGYHYRYIKCLRKEAMSAGLIAIMADFMPGGNMITKGAVSLDNVLRIFQIKPTDWLVCEIRFAGFHAGIAQGDVLIFHPDGTLLASANQSCVLPRREKL